MDVPSQRREAFDKQILHGARSTHVVLCFNKSGRAEPTKEAFDSISFVAERLTKPHLFISGGRAEQSTKMQFGIRFCRWRTVQQICVESNVRESGRAEI